MFYDSITEGFFCTTGPWTKLFECFFYRSINNILITTCPKQEVKVYPNGVLLINLKVLLYNRSLDQSFAVLTFCHSMINKNNNFIKFLAYIIQFLNTLTTKASLMQDSHFLEFTLIFIIL